MFKNIVNFGIVFLNIGAEFYLITLLHLTVFLLLNFLMATIFLDFLKNEQLGFVKNRKMKNFKVLFNFKKNQFLFKDLITSFNLVFEKCRPFKFFWTIGFSSWILGCYFWVINSEPVSTIFAIFSIIFCIISFFKIKDFRKNKSNLNKKENFDFDIFIALAVISVLLMTLSKSLLTGIGSMLYLFIAWQTLKSTKK